VEATKSLSLDPSNYSAHRFLSDTYARLPRHEIARASELLQSQLLQPINLNPVQPSLPLTDLTLVVGAGPAEAAFNEFTPLFTRNNAQLTTTGIVGNHDTYGGESVLTMLYDRTSLSVGGHLSETDGFRENNDITHNLADVYAQVAITPNLNVQAEYRLRDSDTGDLLRTFDPDQFDPLQRRDRNDYVTRLGGRFSPASHSNLILSFIYDNEEATNTFSFIDGTGRFDGSSEGYQVEGQYILQGERFNFVVGGGTYDIDVDATTTLSSSVFSGIFATPSKFEQDNFYLYNRLSLPGNLTLTLGASHDNFKQFDLTIKENNPKLGAEWNLTDWLRLRAAFFETVKRALVVDQTIEPTQVAGFNQLFDDINGTKAKRFGVGLDGRLTRKLYGGIEASRRELDVPVLNFDTMRFQFEDAREDNIQAYLYWPLANSWAVTMAVDYNKFQSDPGLDVELPVDVDTVSVPLAVRYFAPFGLFAEVGVTVVYQDVERRSDATRSEGDDTFALMDATVGYRLPGRRGILSLEARNLFGTKFHFEDQNLFSSEPRPIGLIPDETILARVTFTF